MPNDSLAPFDTLPEPRKRSRKWLWFIFYPAGMVFVVWLSIWLPGRF